MLKSHLYQVEFLLSLIALGYFYKKNRNQSNLIVDQKGKLEKLDQLKSKFFENVSHELRTPLTLILGTIQSILKRDKLDNQDHKFLLMALKINLKR